jgi:hypothetical protein
LLKGSLSGFPKGLGFGTGLKAPFRSYYRAVKEPFTAKQQAQHVQRGFVCLAAVEIRTGAENGTFTLHAAQLYVPNWCPTPGCPSDEVVSVKLQECPQILTDNSGIESDCALYAYEGHCPNCHAPRSGGFGYHIDGDKTFSPPGIGWLFNAGRLVEGRA